MIAHRRLFVLAAVFFITGCLTAFTPAAAQRKKSKPAAKTAASKHRGQKQTASRRSTARRKGQRSAPSRRADERFTVVSTGPPVPDQIEVVEYGSAKLGHEVPAAMRPLPRATPDPAAPASNFNISTKRIEVDIDSSRVIEIQEALAKKGFYNGAPTGVYDEATVEAMRQFQASNQIDVTGYPTAHALKRLGLTSW